MTYPLSQTLGAKRQRTWRAKKGDNQFTEDGQICLSSQPAPRADPLAYSLIDQPDITRPERPCACCRKAFQPTAVRKMLCLTCYHKAWRPSLEPVTIGT